jgi:hypothetical protein
MINDYDSFESVVGDATATWWRDGHCFLISYDAGVNPIRRREMTSRVYS